MIVAGALRSDHFRRRRHKPLEELDIENHISCFTSNQVRCSAILCQGLNALLVDGARRQRAADAGGQRSAERREHDAIVAALREQNALVEKRNRALLGEIATMVFNARRCSVSEEELRRPMTMSDRTRSQAGSRPGSSRQ